MHATIANICKPLRTMFFPKREINSCPSNYEVNPARPVHFWKLYWNKKFLFAHFFVVGQKICSQGFSCQELYGRHGFHCENRYSFESLIFIAPSKIKFRCKCEQIRWKLRICSYLLKKSWTSWILNVHAEFCWIDQLLGPYLGKLVSLFWKREYHPSLCCYKSPDSSFFRCF